MEKVSIHEAGLLLKEWFLAGRENKEGETINHNEEGSSPYIHDEGQLDGKNIKNST
jgi:hypothetical protein